MNQVVTFDCTLVHEMWSKSLNCDDEVERIKWRFLCWLTFDFFWIEGNREIWALKEGSRDDGSGEGGRKRVDWAPEIVTQQDEN